MAARPTIEEVRDRVLRDFGLEVLSDEYVNNKTPLKVSCPLHGEFKVKLNKLTDGQGCPTCGKERSGVSRRKSLKDFKEDAADVHGDKYDYSEVEYTTAKNKVKITCHLHGPFTQLPRNHLSGQGCPSCAKEINSHGKVNAGRVVKEVEASELNGFGGRVYLTPVEWAVYLKRLPVRFPKFKKGSECEVCGSTNGEALQRAHVIGFSKGVRMLALSPDWLDRDSNFKTACRGECNDRVELSLEESERFLKSKGLPVPEWVIKARGRTQA